MNKKINGEAAFKVDPRQPEAPELINDTPQEVKADLRKFNRTEAIVNKTLEELALIKDLKSDEDVEKAMATMKTAKGVENTVETKRTELVKPYNEEVKRINGFAKTLAGKIAPAIDLAKKEVLKYNDAKEKARIEKRTADRKVYLETIGFTLSKGNQNSYENGDITIGIAAITNLTDDLWAGELAVINIKLEARRKKQLEELQTKVEGADFFGEDSSEIKKEIEQAAAPQAAPAYVPAFGSSKSSNVKGLTKRWGYDLVDINQVPREYLQLDTKKIQDAIAAGERNIPGLSIIQKESITIR